MNPVGLLKELVRQPSESGHEQATFDLLEAEYRRQGWRTVRGAKSLHAIIGEAGNLLMYVSHADTVPVGQGWTKPPLEAYEEEGRIYGRGANDAKACVAAMLAGAAAAFSARPPAGRLCLAVTAEEETTGAGMRELLGLAPRPDAAVVGEPTNLAPAVAQKGLLLLTVTSRGRSAHAAWGGGDNAVLSAARDALALAELSFDRDHPALGLPSVAVTQVRGGERHNVIPDLCELTVDVRTTPAYRAEELLGLVRAKVRGEVAVRSSRYEAVDTDPGQAVVAAALAANPGVPAFGSPTVSDWAFLKGLPAVKAGPGDSRRSHTPDEYVLAEEAEEGALYYERLIRAYFGSGGLP